MEKLLPPIKPNKTYEITVDSPHVLYVEESGNPNGIPVIVCHGGPGLGCPPSYRCFFNPDNYRIILFDQRGAGQSKPHACLEHNTTEALIADMEVIRKQLDVDKWVLFGGSWGSTLSLAYAQAHPEHSLGLILRGVFLGTQAELDWLYSPLGAACVFPEYYEQFIEQIPKAERKNLVKAYYKRLTSDNEITRMAAVKAWSAWEARCATLTQNEEVFEELTDPFTALSAARIECHFFLKDAFLKKNQLIKNIRKIAHLPGIIVHGRYDMICALSTAWKLHQAWPNSELKIIREAGHVASEPAITDALMCSCREMAKRLNKC